MVVPSCTLISLRWFKFGLYKFIRADPLPGTFRQGFSRAGNGNFLCHLHSNLWLAAWLSTKTTSAGIFPLHGNPFSPDRAFHEFRASKSVHRWAYLNYVEFVDRRIFWLNDWEMLSGTNTFRASLGSRMRLWPNTDYFLRIDSKVKKCL